MSRTVPVISAMWPAGWPTPTSTSRWRTLRAIPGWSLASTTSKPPEARCRSARRRRPQRCRDCRAQRGGPRRPPGAHVGVECGRALRVLVVLLPPDLAPAGVDHEDGSVAVGVAAVGVDRPDVGPEGDACSTV